MLRSRVQASLTPLLTSQSRVGGYHVGLITLEVSKNITSAVVAWLAQKRSVARTKGNVKVRKESSGFWTEETKRVEM